jgi:rhodanese-related sulfurtransferase
MDQIEEIEHEEQESPSKTLLTGFLIFAGIIVLGLIFMPKQKKSYKLSEEQMLVQLVSHEGVLGPEKIVDLIYQPDDKYQFIDLRSAAEYLKGHLPNAINIPVEHIFDKEYQQILNQQDKINVLYASDHAAACGPWMILTQLGYKNNQIMLGGYNYVNQFIINQFAPMSGNFKDEKPKFDFANIIKQTSGGTAASTNSQTDKSSGSPVTKKKKEAKSSGGC